MRDEVNAHAHILDTALVKCSCGEPFEIGTIADELHQYADHLIAVTEAAVRETIAADIEAAMDYPWDASGMEALRHTARIARGES